MNRNSRLRRRPRTSAWAVLGLSLAAGGAWSDAAAAGTCPFGFGAPKAEQPVAAASPAPSKRPVYLPPTDTEAKSAMSDAQLAMDKLVTSQAAPDNRPVTQQQFKEVIRIFKRVVDRFDAIEKKISQGGAAAGGGDSAVDLNSLNTAGAGEAPIETSNAAGNQHRVSSTAVPDFKVYFDLDLVNRPSVEDLSFDSYHTFLFFEILPTPDIQFSFDVNPNPHFFEMDYNLTPKLQFRAGRIWVPFDDLAPHNIFGGRVNVSRLSIPGNPAFLPDLWTDMGVAMKYTLFDSPKFSMESHLYVVNGFQDGGKDPKGGPVYPSFSDTPYKDNNRAKAIGGRVHMLIGGVFGLGASVYSDKWTSDATSIDESMLLLGLDGSLRLGNTELRTGLLSGNIGLPTDDAGRGGLYGEIGQKFGAKKDWKILLRGGLVQFDDRILTNTTDQMLVGGTLLWKPGFIQYSIETSRDLKDAPGKFNYSYSAFRIVMAF